MTKRYGILLLGLLVMGVGVALVTKAALGTSPISTVPLILSYITPVSFGTMTFLLSLIFIGCQILLLKRFTWALMSQIIIGPIFGLAIDFGMYIFHSFSPETLWVNVVTLIIGCSVVALGIKLQVVANVMMNAGEALVKLIADRLEKPFSIVKISFDWSLVGIACVIGLVFHHSIEGIGVGTIISAFLVGYMLVGIETFIAYWYRKEAVK